MFASASSRGSPAAKLSGSSIFSSSAESHCGSSASGAGLTRNSWTRYGNRLVMYSAHASASRICRVLSSLFFTSDSVEPDSTQCSGSAGASNCGCRVAGTNVDFEKLMRLGFDGLDREIDEWAARNGASTFYDALKMWIESLRSC